MKRLLYLLLPLGLMAAEARASPYWIEYDPSTGLFPEQVGWTHIWDGAPQRWLEGESLVIDTRANMLYTDFYRSDMGGALDPDPGEVFVLRWNVRVDEASAIGDPGIGVFSDDAWGVVFMMSSDTLYSTYEGNRNIRFPAGQFNAFELRSSDMRTYELFVNGQTAMQGTFLHVVSPSWVGWGDGQQGTTSLSRWSYVGYGVIPEPSGLGLTAVAIMLGFRRRRSA